MKKIYLLATALVFGLTVNAQLTDGFEEYPLGPYYGGHWKNWSMASNNSENIQVVNDLASEGSQSGFIGNNGIQDAILDVGVKISDIWTYSMDFHIGFGASGYFNAQHDLGSLGTTGNWAYQAYIGIQPTAGMEPDPGMLHFAAGTTDYNFPYNEEEWVNFAIEHHIDDDIVKLFMNGTEITFGPGVEIPFGDDPAFQGQLSGFDFYSATSINAMHIDNIKFYEGEFMGVQDLTVSEISVYPTVAKDMVNIAAKTNIDNVAVYSTSGQQVLKLNPNSTNAQFNVTALPAGVYMVKIQSGKQVLTKKIVVK